MESPVGLTSRLVPILYDHHVPLSVREGHIRIDGTDVELQAIGYPKPAPERVGMHLEVHVRSQRFLKDRILAESFAEVGADLDDAVEKAFYAFNHCSLHTILAAFVDRRLGAGQTDWEYWGSGDHRWDVCLGPVTPKTSGTCAQGTIMNGMDYGSFLNELRDAYLLEASPEMHWLRIYRGSLHGKCVAREVLLDNVNWPSGEAILDRSDWPAGPDFYSIREFMVACPVVQDKKWWKIW